MSDIDDAPIVTADENKELALLNEAKKEKLKISKENLLQEQQNMRRLAPLVEQGACFFLSLFIYSFSTSYFRLPENETSLRQSCVPGPKDY